MKAMASSIQQFLNKILSSRYGKDVRQAIHDGIHQCYEDGKAGAIDLVAREQIANLVANDEDSDGNSELIDIRVGADGKNYPTAGEAVRGQYELLLNEINNKTFDVDSNFSEDSTNPVQNKVLKAKFDTYDELLGVDVHNFTYVKPKLIRCNWDWAENENGSLCKTEALETPQYIIVNKNVACNTNGMNMFSASSDFGSASPSPFGILFRKQYIANEMVPTYMYGDKNYKYFRMMFPYSADLEVTFVYDTFRPYNDYEDDTTTVLGNTDIQTYLGMAYEESSARLRLFAFVPYYPKTYYFKRASFASTLMGNDKSVFGVYDDIMLGDTIPQNVILSTAANGYKMPYTYARKIGEVTDITKDGDSLRSYIFDGSNVQSYYPKYIAFPIAQIAGSYTDRKTALDIFNDETEIDHWKGWDASLIPLNVSKGGLNFIDLKSSLYATPFSESPLIGSSWILFGDSLTHQYCGQNYNDDLPAAKIAREFNISFDNRAYSGTHICTGGSVDDSTHNGVAMLDALISEIEEGTTTAPDYITIAYGSNGSSTNTGTTESTSENTDTTIGAMKYFIEKIREKMPETVFGFILPPKSTWNGNYGRDVAATRNAMLECLALEDYHVPYCDMWTESGITLAMLPDGIHIKTAQSQNLYYHALRRFMMGL